MILKRLVFGGLFAALAIGAAQHAYAGDSVTLTPAQQERLQQIRKRLDPASKVNWSGFGLEKSAEFCGANIPLEVDPSTVAYEDSPDKPVDRSEVPDVCHAVGEPVAYTCGYKKDADPFVKELVRANVKKVVCKRTKNASEVDPYNFQKWTLENGALTFTWLAGKGASNVLDNGMSFLKKRASHNGITLAGYLLKQDALERLSVQNSTTRKLLKNECGLDPTITIDSALADEYAEHPGYSLLAVCDMALQTVYNFCARPGEFESYNKAAVKAELTKNLKGIACTRSKTPTMGVDYKGGVLTIASSFGSVKPNKPGTNTPYMDPLDFTMAWLKDNATKGGSAPSEGTSAKDGAQAKTSGAGKVTSSKRVPRSKR